MRAIHLLSSIVVLSAAALAVPSRAADNTHSYTAGKFALDLNGVLSGWVKSVEGGHATSNVVTEGMGVDTASKKHLAGVKYEDITMQLGTGLSKELYAWIGDSVAATPTRKNGAVISVDYDNKERSRLTFFNALVTEVRFPALDASSKDPVYMTLKISPESTRDQTSAGNPDGGAFNNLPTAKKLWNGSSYRLAIDGIDTSKVSKIEAVTLKRTVMDNMVGAARTYVSAPGSSDRPKLVVTLADSAAKGFYDWQGGSLPGNAAAPTKDGSLDYLTADMKETLFTLHFTRLTLSKITPDKVENDKDAIHRVKVEMYVESVQFHWGAVSWD